MFGLDFSIPTLAGRGQKSGFSPVALPGLAAWYDPSDLSTLFQDAAMTVPVTATGQPVGGMHDKSGNGHHLTAATNAERPTYQSDGTAHWLEADGVDDMLTGTSPVSGNPALGVGVAMRGLSAPDNDHRVFQVGDSNGAFGGSFGTGGLAWRYNNGNVIFDSLTLGADTALVWVHPDAGLYGDGGLFRDGMEESFTARGNANAVPSGTGQMYLFGSNAAGPEHPNMRLYQMVVAESFGASDISVLSGYLKGNMP